MHGRDKSLYTPSFALIELCIVTCSRFSALCIDLSYSHVKKNETIIAPADRHSFLKVTGGGGELALITARALLEHGATGLCLIDLSFSPTALAEIDSLKADFPSVQILHDTADVTSASSLEASFDRATSRLRSIDILVTFAGVVGCTHALDMTAEDFRKTLDVNTTGTFLSAQAAAKRMVTQPYGGNIVFIASISGSKVNFPQPQAAYNASKAAVVS